MSDPNESQEKSAWLEDLLFQVFWPLDAFIAILNEHDDNAHLLAVLIPLMDQAKSDFKIIYDVLAQSFGGDIRVETSDSLETWKAFARENFKRAFVEPAAPEGGA